MNLFSIADKLAQSDRAPIILDANRCVHNYDRFSKCEVCVRACPVDALHLDTAIRLDEKACVACGLCLRVCPVGALTGDDGSNDLANFVSRLPTNQEIELGCSRHSSLEQGSLENVAVIRTNTCLAALGPSIYIQLLKQSPQIFIRMDACAECSLGRAQPAIEQTIQAVRNLSSLRDEGERVTRVIEKPGALAQPRPVYDPKKPLISRRDLFRIFAAEGPEIASNTWEATSDQPSGKVPPLERRRLLKTLEQFVTIGSAPVKDEAILVLGLVQFTVNENCTACGLCARICPTGAMQFCATNDNQFRLTMQLNHCTNCGVCVDMCESVALQREDMSTWNNLLSTEPKTLKTGMLKECVKCKAKFAASIEGNLCPICQYRRAHPFGSRLPRNV